MRQHTGTQGEQEGSNVLFLHMSLWIAGTLAFDSTSSPNRAVLSPAPDMFGLVSVTAANPAPRYRRHTMTNTNSKTSRTPDKIEALVAQIGSMELEELRTLWKQRYGSPPSLRSIPIMRRQLAWRVQADHFGGLDAATRKTLARKGLPEPEGLELGIGARLSRNWKGKRIEVVVEEEGFRWKDELYPSLSAAARAITGIRWNGPRFFGLRG